jgi:hypothetical protein
MGNVVMAEILEHAGCRVALDFIDVGQWEYEVRRDGVLMHRGVDSLRGTASLMATEWITKANMAVEVGAENWNRISMHMPSSNELSSTIKRFLDGLPNEWGTW